jgi:hypothetical protein
MPLMASDDFGAGFFEQDRASDLFNELTVHNHQFPSANTGIPHLLDMPEWVMEAHREFLEDVMRVDIFGIKPGGTIDSPLIAPIRPDVPALEPGATYLLETVIRTVKMGHLFTQGTSDSNEVWMDVTVTSGGRVIGRSGGQGQDGEVDPWSHFVNAFVLDREGYRIDRRNAQDIFVSLYNHQIPPGAGDVVHYTLTVPQDVVEPITVDVKLQFRKFDTTYMKFVKGAEFVNDLPITTLAVDRVTFPVRGASEQPHNTDLSIPRWERVNDYGIGLLRKGSSASAKGELRQAEAAFAEVEQLDRPDGPLNRARVYVKEGRLEEAVAALEVAAGFDPPAPPWSVAWFSGIVNKQNGNLGEAIVNFESAVAMKDTEVARQREFDFSQDYRLLNELAQTIFERAKQERGPDRLQERRRLLNEALDWFHEVLELDPENVTAHYNLGLIYAQLGDETRAEAHRQLHATYKPDDNARDRAIAAARTIVIYDLQRHGAYELTAQPTRIARDD